MLLRCLTVCLLCLCLVSCTKKQCPPVIQPQPTTTYLSPPSCNLPIEPHRLGPSGGRAEKNEDGKETGYVIVSLKWMVDVFLVNDEERVWREAAAKCLEAR